MEKELTNIAEILRYAPKGLRLYSPLCGECNLQSVWDECGLECGVWDACITVKAKGTDYAFNRYAHWVEHGECLLFPSKEHRTWDDWQEVLFKAGDYITSDFSLTFKVLSRNVETRWLLVEGTDNWTREVNPLKYRYATPSEIEAYKSEEKCAESSEDSVEKCGHEKDFVSKDEIPDEAPLSQKIEWLHNFVNEQCDFLCEELRLIAEKYKED